MDTGVILLTRGSPLALRQAELSSALLSKKFPAASIETRIVTTTGDKQTDWSLEKAGGRGLFTSELEHILLSGKGDIAVHSAKDLPTEIKAGLTLAGCLPRANPADILVRREHIVTPAVIATGSPRRQMQASAVFPKARFVELRGNVATRLQKIAQGVADATFLAAAGLERLGITEQAGLVFEEWGPDKMVPAAGQGAIAWETRIRDASDLGVFCDPATTYAVTVERAFLAALGAGCHSAFAAHYTDDFVWLFHDHIGRRAFPFIAVPATDIPAYVAKILKQFFACEK
ncbi:MAG: hydroxymethylbilane synthase [Puniceicoccales bacterium]|nr:hydroxymethylbilane synthase [Puniceicoccales bacterium]